MATERVAYSGQRFTILWARDRRGDRPAERYFDTLNKSEKAKFLTLFKYLGDHGRIRSKEKFRKLTGEGVWEFKIGGHRLIGDFRPGGVFVISHGTEKKTDRLRPEEFEIAKRVLSEHDEGGAS